VIFELHLHRTEWHVRGLADKVTIRFIQIVSTANSEGARNKV